MTNEKVISYLNIKKDGKIDKSMSKICLGFNIGFTILLIGVILLFHISNPFFICIFWTILDITYFIFIILYHNPLLEIPLSFIGLLVGSVKLFYGYIISSKFEFIEYGIPVFTFMHATILVIALGVIAYLLVKFHQTYKILKDNTIEVAKKKIASKNPMPRWVALIVLIAGSPMIFVRLLRDDLQNIGLGLGFSMWTLGIIFAILFAMLLPKFVVLVRFRVWNFPEYRK